MYMIKSGGPEQARQTVDSCFALLSKVAIEMYMYSMFHMGILLKPSPVLYTCTCTYHVPHGISVTLQNMVFQWTTLTAQYDGWCYSCAIAVVVRIRWMYWLGRL